MCAEMKEAFVTLRDRFAYNIHVAHPHEDLPYFINTDESAKAIGAVLMQQDREGNTTIMSTATRVLTQRNSAIQCLNKSCMESFCFG